MKRSSVILIYVLILVLGLGASLLVYGTAQRVADNNQRLFGEAIADLGSLAGLRADIAEHERLALELYAAIDADLFGPQLLEQRARVEERMPILAQLGMDESDIEQIEVHWRIITEQASALIDNIDGRLTDWDGAREQLRVMGENRRLISPILDRLGERLDERLEVEEARNYEDLHFMTWLVAGYTVVIFSIAFVVGAILRRLFRVNEHNRALAEFPARNPHPVFSADRLGRVRYANRAAEWFARKALGHHAGVEELFPDSMVKRLRSRDPEQERGFFESKVGDLTLAYSWRWLQDQNIFHIYAEDITEKKAAELRLKSMIFEDAVTGLNNRQGLMAFLESRLDEGDSVYLLMLSVDRFHMLPASVGFSLADEVIHHLGEGIQARVRENFESETRTARLESAVFAVAWTPERTDVTQAQRAREFRDSLPSVVRTGRVAFHTAFRMGVGYADGSHKSDAETLLRDVGTALQAAEQTPGKTLVVYDQSLRDKQRDTLLVEEKLREAISTGARGLEPYLQPKIDLRSGRVVGAEVLLRWFDPELGNIPPDRFIPIAEQSGLIIDLGQWILKHGLGILHDWREDPHFGHLHLAHNVTATELQSEHYAVTLIDALDRMGIPAGQIELEITERILAATDSTDYIETLSRLRQVGVQVSIDDFGTGYSSLAYLSKMPISHIKIDKQFIDTMLLPDQPALTSIIIELARELGLKCVAEGVEHAAQAEFLRRHNCDMAQGYLFSRPLTRTDFEAFIANSHDREHLPQ